MRILVLALCAFGFAACSSSSTTSNSGPCAQRKGAYVTDLKVRTGNCSTIAESVNVVDKQPTEVVAPCTGAIEYSADNCHVTLDQTCPDDADAPGAVSHSVATATWSADGSSSTGIFSLTLTSASGAVLCQGTYDYSAHRQ